MPGKLSTPLGLFLCVNIHHGYSHTGIAFTVHEPDSNICSQTLDECKKF